MDTKLEGPNHELFVKVLAQIEREPEKWDQADWRCSTGMCFAGWTTVLAGLQWRHPEHEDDNYVVWEGGTEHCGNVAAVLLGLTNSADDEDLISQLDRSGGLFDACNDLDDLYQISANILGLDETVLRDKVAAEVSS